MKIFINRTPIYNQSYGGGNLFVQSFWSYFKHKGYQVTNKLDEDIDIIFLFDPRYENENVSINEILQYKNTHRNVKIIHRVNECDARKGTNNIDSILIECSKWTNKTIFVGEWLQNYFSKRWLSENKTDYIHNGCDKDIFKTNQKYSKNNNKVNIISWHWSDNKYKNNGLHEWLDDFVDKNKDFSFSFIGRLQENLKNTKLFKPMYGKELGDEVGKYDICINKSYCDPFSNSCIEAISCGLPLYVHKDGGGCVEMSGLDHVYDTFEDLEKILLSKQYKKNIYVPISWKDCMEKYENVIMSLL